MSMISVISGSGKSAPNAPTIGTATNVGTGRAYNNGRADVTFTAPTYNGRSAITGYTVTSSPGGFTGTGASSPISVTGLQSSVSYTFTVTATNAVGTSAASAASNSITATTVPQAPTIGTATGGDASATITYTAGATGGSAITTFTATSSPGSITGTGASPITVSGLTNGTAYTFTVTATNANGTSSASAASNSVTPVQPGALSAWSSGTTIPTPSGEGYLRYFFSGFMEGDAGGTTRVFYGGGGTAAGSRPQFYYQTANNSVTNPWSTSTFTIAGAYSLGNQTGGVSATYFDNYYHLVGNPSTPQVHITVNFSGSSTRASYPINIEGFGNQLTATSTGVYGVGGVNNAGINLSQVYQWTPNAWGAKTNYPIIVSTVGLAGGNGYIVGAGGNSGAGAIATAYVYTESSNSWSSAASYPIVNNWFQGTYVGTGSTGNSVNRYYFAQGFPSNTSAIYSYSVSTNSWRTERSAPTGNRGTNFTWDSINRRLWNTGGDDFGAQQNTYYTQVI
jgi:trimeric autotransporter adhesin